MKKQFLALTTALVLAVSLPAIAQMQAPDMQKMMEALTPKSDDPQSTKDFKQAHTKMMKNMHTKFSGDASKDFAESMIKHHEGGIEMAQIMLKHGKDPEMRKMAEKLIKEQSDENKQFRAWLAKHKN